MVCRVDGRNGVRPGTRGGGTRHSSENTTSRSWPGRPEPRGGGPPPPPENPHAQTRPGRPRPPPEPPPPRPLPVLPRARTGGGAGDGGRNAGKRGRHEARGVLVPPLGQEPPLRRTPVG